MLLGIMWVCILSVLVSRTVRDQTRAAVGQLKEKLLGDSLREEG